MNLYEHQSTYNPNMPLRGLLYFAQLYNKYIAEYNLNVFSSGLQRIPAPQYIVFYNGTKEQPDEQIQLLSEAFLRNSQRQYVEGCLECEGRMLNINYGHNRELMEKCKRLSDYAIFVSRVRQYTAEEPESPRKAITRAVDECIDEGILDDILSSQKAEVLEMVLTTFNRELYERDLKAEGAREAIGPAEERGARNHLISQVEKKLSKNKTVREIAEALEEEISVIEEIIAELQGVE